MKLIIPHIHKILGDAGFYAKISERGEIKELRVRVLEGLRQIEGIIIGRRVFETPLIISRICGICPTSHILNACQALEKALEIKPSWQTENLRKLITAAQIIQSHAGHAFFASFFGQKLPKESEAVLKLREFALSIIEMVGGRTVHPMTPIVGGFTKIPEKSSYKKVLENSKKAKENSLLLIDFFKKMEYPGLKRKTLFCSSFSKNDYPYHKGQKVKIGDEVFSSGDFFSNQIEEDLKNPPSKRVEFQGKTYMLGPMARIKNNGAKLNQGAKLALGAKLIDFENTFHNTFCQAVEILHFLEEIEKILKELLKEKQQQAFQKYKISQGSGLGVLEAPRGTLFTYLGVDKNGRISDCTIITPTAQFLRNLEEDLRSLAPLRTKKVKQLIRAYDPCIACAVH